MVDMLHLSDFIYRNASNFGTRLGLTVAGTQIAITLTTNNIIPSQKHGSKIKIFPF
jgi:hypothetical protein